MLAGVNVVEFGQYVAAPATGMLLADLGATVVKVERPDGDPLAPLPAYHVWNRGKQVVRLDLTTVEGREEAEGLVERADVVLDGLKPGALARMGLAVEELRRARPRLTTVKFNGFHPESGASIPAWEPLIGAHGGVMRPSQMLQILSEPETTFTPLPLASNFAALHAAADVVTTLFAGRGAGIEVDLSGALYTGLCAGAVFVNGRPARIGHFPGEPRDGDPYESVINGQSAMYICADGARTMIWISAKERPAFLASLGLDPVSDEAGEGWTRDSLREALTRVFSGRAALEWERLLAAQGFCAIKVRNVEQWIHDDHASRAELSVDVETVQGTMKQPGPLVQAVGGKPFSATGPRSTNCSLVAWAPPRPALGPGPGSGPGDATRPLAGVRVIDTCIVLAGPTVGRLLAEFGAEVIKIDSPRRPMIERAWLDVNRGKHSVLLDLETEQGTAILAEMLGSADVFLQNFRPGVIERLGFGYDAVAATHPELIYGSFNAYGWDGPLSNLPGWEQYAQAISGIQVRNGARGGTPRTTTFTINDYGTGVAGALGIAAALYERRHTGKGRHVRGSLTATAGFHQALYMVDFAGHAREEIEGTKAVGWSALSRLYRCSDHPAYLQATVGDLGALSACNGLADLPIEGDDLGPESDLAMELERRFGEADAATWERRLRGIGVGFARARTIPEFVTDPEARRLGHLASRVVPGYGRVDTVGSCSRFDGSRPPVPIAAMPGADTVRVLRDLEIDEQRIADLFEAGVLQSCAEGIVPQQTETAGV